MSHQNKPFKVALYGKDFGEFFGKTDMAWKIKWIFPCHYEVHGIVILNKHNQIVWERTIGRIMVFKGEPLIIDFKGIIIDNYINHIKDEKTVHVENKLNWRQCGF